MVDKIQGKQSCHYYCLPLLFSILKKPTLASGITASFKTFYEQEIDTWSINVPGGVVAMCRL